MKKIIVVMILAFAGNVMAMEYGQPGPYKVTRSLVGTVSVFMPDKPDPSPVMFFGHGLGASHYLAYRSLLTHVASRGMVVVFSPYPFSTLGGWKSQYDTMWNGHVAAVTEYASRMDLTRIGFFGHSFGAGASPNMASRALEEGWGTNGMLLYIMAPGPVYGMTYRQLRSFTHGQMIVQSFADDTLAPEFIATSLYATIGIPDEEKARYVTEGNHNTPSDREVDDIDRLAIWKPLDALMDYTFQLDYPDYGKLFAIDGAWEHYETVVYK